MDGWSEAGTSAPVIPKQSEMAAIPAPSENAQYKAVTKRLEQLHTKLNSLEEQGKLANNSDQVGLAGEYQRKLRLDVNMLFAFMNQYIDVLSDLQKEYAELWTKLFREHQGTANAKTTNADANTKQEKYMIEIVKNRIQQIKNDYERYNGICISLQSTVKAENTERILG